MGLGAGFPTPYPYIDSTTPYAVSVILELLLGSDGSTLNSTTTYSAETEADAPSTFTSRYSLAATKGVAPGEPIPVSDVPVSSAYTRSLAVWVVANVIVDNTVAEAAW